MPFSLILPCSAQALNLGIGFFSKGRYKSTKKYGIVVSATWNPLYFKYFGSDKNDIFFAEEKVVKPHFPFAVASAMHCAKSLLA